MKRACVLWYRGEPSPWEFLVSRNPQSVKARGNCHQKESFSLTGKRNNLFSRMMYIIETIQCPLKSTLLISGGFYSDVKYNGVSQILNVYYSPHCSECLMSTPPLQWECWKGCWYWEHAHYDEGQEALCYNRGLHCRGV